MRYLPVNQQSILVELADLQQTLVLLASLQAKPIAGVQELVPGARTILLEFAPQIITAQQLVNAIDRRDLHTSVQQSAVLVEIPVRYEGEDLAEVAQILGISTQEVVRRHTQSEWSVAFTGFTPGFAYLTGGDPIFNVPRRSTPRTKVPAGAVALADTFSAVYPQASPGGWQIIGITDAAMWDLSRELPALLQPGYRVKFVDLAKAKNSRSLRKKQALAAPQKALETAAGPALKVNATGLLTLFQDLGRHGQAGQGVSVSGAMDQVAFKTANRLVGNCSDWPVLETTGGGLVLQSVGETVVAVTGADAQINITSQSGHHWSAQPYTAVALADGDTLSIRQPAAGLRCYVAVRGGYQVTAVLGSAATDTLAHIGPQAVQRGQFLSVHSTAHGAVADQALAPEQLPVAGGEVVLDVEFGPHTDWFTLEAIALLCNQLWQVTDQSNRVGLRLAGQAALTRSISGELPSEGAAWGAIQVPPSGQPVLFLADHPLTGGYPVIACVAPHHLDLAGQIPVGAWIRFHPIASFTELMPSL